VVLAASSGGEAREGRNPSMTGGVGGSRLAGNTEILLKRGWSSRVTGILSRYPVLPIEIANRLGGSK